MERESASLAVNVSPESRRGHMECMTVVVPRAFRPRKSTSSCRGLIFNTVDSIEFKLPRETGE